MIGIRISGVSKIYAEKKCFWGSKDIPHRDADVWQNGYLRRNR
jgi:hypothetical protein